FEEGSTGYTLTWVVTDTNPSTYTIYSNGTVVSSGSWLSDQAISYSVDDLGIGTHNITIVATDSTGLSATDSVTVTILSSTNNNNNNTTKNPISLFSLIISLLGISFIGLLMRKRVNKS
ncbi:MAG: hypothetical protein ACTSVB_00120, partial [Candidatus Heimdallarchaeaceae archaeon]